MHIMEFLQLDAVALPRKRKTGEVFRVFLENLFRGYLLAVDNLDSDAVGCSVKKERHRIEQLCSIIEASVKLYFEGMPYNAFNIFSDKISGYLIYNYDYYFGRKEDFNRDVLPLYRVRKSKERITSKKDMFHIPFEKNGIVEPYRYSITGVPCLYLGSSPDICLRELSGVQKKDDEHFYISTFDLNKNYDKKIKLLNFGTIPRMFGEYIKKNYNNSYPAFICEELRDYLVCWPLIAACSIKVQNEEDFFKPEYIIPQLLLQWIRVEGSFDGIQYFSTKLEENKYPCDYLAYQNFVFPPKKVRERGICGELASMFEWSEPILY